MILLKILNFFVSFVKNDWNAGNLLLKFPWVVSPGNNIFRLLWESDFQNQAHASGIFSDSGPVLAYYTNFVRTPFWGHQLVT